MTKYSKIQPYCAPDFSDSFVIEFWFSQLGDFGIDELGTAMQKLCTKPKFPCVEDIKKECGILDEVSDDAIGREMAERIWTAIGKYGARNWEPAMDYLGELGQKVIGGTSGWVMICDTASYANAGMFKAQWRESTKGHLEMARKGHSDEPPKLPPMNEALRLRREKESNTGLAAIDGSREIHRYKQP